MAEETKKLTLSELYDMTNLTTQTVICAKSGYNGKILCKRFDPVKHSHIAKRLVCSAWASLRINTGVLSTYAQPIIECYVDGYPEYEKEHGRNDG